MENWKLFHTAYQGKSTTKVSKWWISDYGRVKITYNYKDKVKYPKLSVISNNHHSGYLAISINNAIEKYVHRLVGRFFLDEPSSPDKVTIDHINGDKLCNFADNLRWFSYSENSLSRPDRKMSTKTKELMSRRAKEVWAERKRNN